MTDGMRSGAFRVNCRVLSAAHAPEAIVGLILQLLVGVSLCGKRRGALD